MKKSTWNRFLPYVAGVLLCLSFALSLGQDMLRQMKFEAQHNLQKYAEQMYMPSLAYLQKDTRANTRNWMQERALSWIPLVRYISRKEAYQPMMEDAETIARILASQANDENIVDANGMLIGEDIKEQTAPVENQPIDLSIERLRDFEYLLKNFYTVDSSTMIYPDDLNVDELLGNNMKIEQNGGPKVLIFHTHSQEGFADSVPGDSTTSIVGVGEYLCQQLNEKGIETIHDIGVYDIIDGQLDRSNAYENAEASVRAILEANPSIEVAIDLHRDGVAEGRRLVTEVNGKATAQIMYFNGLSRTRTNGDIEYLYNPYIADNLAFSLQMQLASERLAPGFVRHIYLRGYRYNLHLLPKSLLIEAGAQTNTVEEMMNAMEVLAESLHQVLVE